MRWRAIVEVAAARAAGTRRLLLLRLCTHVSSWVFLGWGKAYGNHCPIATFYSCMTNVCENNLPILYKEIEI